MGDAKKIVVLEDDKASCRLVSAFLEKQGHHVIPTHEARFAIELTLKEQPDLLIADVLLPDMNGSEAVKQLRASRRGDDLKVLFLTSLLGKKSDGSKPLSLTLNGENFPALAKPFKPKLLAEVIKSIFEEVDAERARFAEDVNAKKEAAQEADDPEPAGPEAKES